MGRYINKGNGWFKSSLKEEYVDYARNKYVVHRELASGKGFADLVLLPATMSTLPPWSSS